MIKPTEKLSELYSRRHRRSIDWIRELGPFEHIELQGKARCAVKAGGELTSRAVQLLDEMLSKYGEKKNDTRRIENDRRVRLYGAAQDYFLRLTGALEHLDDEGPVATFQQELQETYGCIDLIVMKHGATALAAVKARHSEDPSVAQASGKELFRAITGENVEDPNPTSCKCFILADFLADRIRRCEEAQTLEERMMYLIAWLIATDPSFDPSTIGLHGFRAWESDAPDGNPYDHRESIADAIGWSCSGLYLGTPFRNEGFEPKLRLHELLPLVAEVSLLAIQRDQDQLDAGDVKHSPPNKHAADESADTFSFTASRAEKTSENAPKPHAHPTRPLRANSPNRDVARVLFETLENMKPGAHVEAKAIYEGLGMSVSFLRRHKNRPDGEWSENRLDQVPGTLLGRPSAYYRESVLRWLRNYVTVSDGEMIRIAALPARPPGGTTVAASA